MNEDRITELMQKSIDNNGLSEDDNAELLIGLTTVLDWNEDNTYLELKEGFAITAKYVESGSFTTTQLSDTQSITEPIYIIKYNLWEDGESYVYDHSFQKLYEYYEELLQKKRLRQLRELKEEADKRNGDICAAIGFLIGAAIIGLLLASSGYWLR